MAAGGKRDGAGRKPLPVAVKKIKGTLQKCRTNPHAPKSTGMLCTPPEYMSDAAKEAWNYAVANSPPGLLSALDGAVLERWANCSGMYREALEMKGYESEKGFTPASRSRVQVAQESQHPDDPWTDIAG